MTESEVTRTATHLGPILLVEDDQSLAAALVEVLRATGFEVEVANTREDAVRRLDFPDPVALVITDVRLPGNGGRVMYHARLQSREVPFVVLTGTSGPEVEQLARRAGAVNFIRKPVRTRALRAAALEAIGFGFRSAVEDRRE